MILDCADCDRAGVDRQSQRRSFQLPNLLGPAELNEMVQYISNETSLRTVVRDTS
jgi:hypothetical protein